MVIAYKSLTDNELAALLKEGDHLAFTEIYNRYNALLYVFAYKKLHDREEVKDLIHELFLWLWTNHDHLLINTGLAPYLYTCARNRVINVISHKKICSKYIDSLQSFIDQGTNCTDHLIRQKEILAYIEKEIAALPVKMRNVFEMSRKENMSRKEISRHLNISEETVKSQVHSALKILRVKLGSLLFSFCFFFL